MGGGLERGVEGKGKRRRRNDRKGRTEKEREEG